MEEEAPAGQEAKGVNLNETTILSHETNNSWLQSHKWWLQIAIYTFFVIAGSAAGTLLGRIYYDKGGHSTWVATFVQNCGFPAVIPFYWISRSKSQDVETNRTQKSVMVLAAVYVFLGIFLAADCMLYSIGLMYLPVTTYTLISASQLGFTALFSYFFNAQKLTPYIINSLVLLTISVTLLVFQPDSGDTSGSSGKKYKIGFACTIAASAGYALMLSVTQLVFQKIIKKESFREILNMSFYQTLVATLVILIGVFASGDWKTWNREMEEFETGKVAYVMNLFWTAVSWQAFTVGYVALIYKVSSLFSNVISMLSLPVAPVLAAIFFGDKITGLKVVSMLMALWGFASYIYQHYLDDERSRSKEKQSSNVTEVPLVERR